MEYASLEEKYKDERCSYFTALIHNVLSNFQLNQCLTINLPIGCPEGHPTFQSGGLQTGFTSEREVLRTWELKSFDLDKK